MLPKWRAGRCLYPLFLLVVIVAVLCGCTGGGEAPAAETTQQGSSSQNNPMPAISSLSPSSATVGAASTTVTIIGSGFVQGSVVQWNQNNRPTNFVSATQLQMTLTDVDLAAGQVAQISVVNPGPGGGASAAATFTVNNPTPQIMSVSPSTVTTISGGSTITVTGSGFVPTSTITWNGANRATKFMSATQLQATLLASDVASPGTAQIGVSNPAPGGGTSSTTQPLTIVSPPPSLTLNASPNPLLVYPNSTVTLQIGAQTKNTSAIPSVTLGPLPPGITTTTTFPLAIPTGVASINFQVDSTIAAGNSYNLAVFGQADSASASIQVPAVVQSNPPTFFFARGLFSEVGVPFGGSGQIQFMALPNGQANRKTCQ